MQALPWPYQRKGQKHLRLSIGEMGYRLEHVGWAMGEKGTKVMNYMSSGYQRSKPGDSTHPLYHCGGTPIQDGVSEDGTVCHMR